MSVHSGYGAEVRRVGDPSVHDQHLMVDDCRQRQPAEYLLQKLQNLFAMHLHNAEKLTVTHTNTSMSHNGARVGFIYTPTLYFARTSLVKPYLGKRHSLAVQLVLTTLLF